MAGDSNQRISWWKFKSKGSQDPNNDDPDHQHMPLSLSPHDNDPPATSSVTDPTTTISHPPAESSTQHFKDLREQFIQSKNTDLSNNSIFGVELEKSLQVASAKIYVPNSSQANDDDNENKPADVAEYGEIPVVVAKCGSFLKLNGLSVEGIFRVGGSSKRVKELQQIFSEAPDYGKKLDWDGFTVHDAASLLRRYLNSLPQPVIPLDQYEAFRAPLKSRPRVLAYFTYRGVSNPPKDNITTTSSTTGPIASTPNPGSAGGAPQLTSAHNSSTTPAPSQFVAQVTRKPVPILSDDTSSSQINTAAQDEPADSAQEQEQPEVDEKTKELAKKRRRRLKKHKRFVEDIKGASEEYQKLVAGLPILRKKLLLYILDLLDAFSEHSEENRMSSSNLSAVFQPSILSHPKHDMSPDEYVLSQKVVEFLVEYSYKLLPEQTGVQIHHQQ
ncbi:GTPase-activating protein [Saccharomycopsis crataegensis]|uniref:GTPase-activating protein n=1 Tax=Saccharomycopsis crataegensis TaxID=43959 RepID=A0AAV5QKR0_9ASCO|nr:GTPase-activating protein [Saccharomycopsis crataegensis]